MSNFNVLLESLLNMSKLDAGVIKPEITPVNLEEIFSWLELTFAQLCIDKQLRFKLYFPTSTPLVVRADFGLLKSVLMNLVSNAIKFTSQGGVLISARPRGDNILFQVWDTGIGIKEEEIDKIFDDFYQINNPQRDRTQGLGLGLSIAKRSLALFDGKILCRSQFGHGSVFGFPLPMDNMSNHEILGSHLPAPMELESIRQFVKSKRFVIVEDDVMVSEALATALTVMGGKVDSYYDAEVALQQANIENADCYIVDYMLPGQVDGTNFLLSIHQKLHKSPCAVMMSGNTSTYFINKAKHFDWPLVHKPANIEKLISKLSERYKKPL
jgi:CheY-like chemotaxis protein